MRKTYTYEMVKDIIEQKGYKLLSTTYENTTSKLELMCPKGHIYTTKFSSILYSNSKCPKCKYEKMGNDTRYTYERIKEIIENEGYKLLSTEYKQMNAKLKLECPVGHIFEVKLANFIHRKSRCPHCYYKLVGDSFRYSYNYVKSKFKERGFILLSKEYKNSNHKLKYICKRGHITTIMFSQLLQGQGCKKCGYIDNSGKNNWNWKGGISKVRDLVRRNPRYLEWQIASKNAYGNQCVISGKGNVQVHHLVHPFYKTLNKHFGNYETEISKLPMNDRERVIDKFFDEHNKVLGVPLNKYVHEEFHKLYGVRKFTQSDFEEFYLTKTGKQFKLKEKINDE